MTCPLCGAPGEQAFTSFACVTPTCKNYSDKPSGPGGLAPGMFVLYPYAEWSGYGTVLQVDGPMCLVAWDFKNPVLDSDCDSPYWILTCDLEAMP